MLSLTANRNLLKRPVMKSLRCILGVLLVVLGAALPGAARADVLYGITFSNQLITIDPTTGAGTLVGNLDTNMQAFGIAALNGNLYAFDQTARMIRQIDPSTGHTLSSIAIPGTSDLIGEGDLTFRSDGFGFISTVSGGGSQSPSLLRFVLSPNSQTVRLGGLAPAVMDGLAFNNNILYGLKQGSPQTPLGGFLYTINITTAVTTQVGGPLPGTSDAIFGGLASRSDGSLFATMANNSTYSDLFLENTSTGNGTLIGQITGFNDVTGIAFLSPGLGAPGSDLPAPEPSSAVLLTLGIAGCAVWTRTRRRAALR
jgi:hypothetical protein